MRGGKVEHRPGAHYFATRLFDSRLCAHRPDRAPRRHERADRLSAWHGANRVPQVGLRRQRAEGRADDRRALAARARHRPQHEAIDRRGGRRERDQHRLLEPSLDVEAWLERKRLVERPAAPRKTTLFVEAKLKRTQAISLGPAWQRARCPSSRHPPDRRAAARSPSRAPRNPRRVARRRPSRAARGRTKMLSIGLHAEGRPGRAREPRPDRRRPARATGSRVADRAFGHQFGPIPRVPNPAPRPGV